MHKSPKVSVIIPVYGVEKYIEKSIQSLLDQSYTNFEAIIVDDGSPDNSIAIAKKLVRNDPRFIFLEKENGGQSSARNMGLEYVTGEYIAFLDPDDYLDKKCFQKVIEVLIKSPAAEIVLFGHSLVDESGNILHRFIPDLEGYKQKKDYLLSEKTIDYSIWSKIFKKDIFKNYRFVNGLLYEDKHLVVQLLLNREIKSISRTLYFYVQRSGSTMNSYNPNCIRDYTYIYNSFKKFLEENNLFFNNYEYYCRSYLLECHLSLIVQLAKYSPNYKKDCIELKEKANQSCISWKSIFQNLSVFSMQFWAVAIFKVSPKLFRILILLKSKYE